jgi:hypothetical protein
VLAVLVLVGVEQLPWLTLAGETVTERTLLWAVIVAVMAARASPHDTTASAQDPGDYRQLCSKCHVFLLTTSRILPICGGVPFWAHFLNLAST